MLPCILLQLTILCTSLLKPCYRKNDDSPVIHRSHVTPCYVFFNVLDFIEAECSIHRNQYFIRSKNCVLNFTTVRYSLQKCSETILCLKQQLTVHVSPVSRALRFTEARKTCYRVVGTSICTLESFAIKVVSSRLPRR